MKSKTMIAAAALAVAMFFAPGVMAQEKSYTPGTVWNVAGISIKPGQGDNYMDYLATTWKKAQEFGMKEGWVVSYHVFSVNNARVGEPDLYLAIEYKDYATTAQQEELQKKFFAMMATDSRKEGKAFADRETMRTTMGSMEMQELKLK